MESVPLTMLNGFFGAEKTTLLNRLRLQAQLQSETGYLAASVIVSSDPNAGVLTAERNVDARDKQEQREAHYCK